MLLSVLLQQNRCVDMMTDLWRPYDFCDSNSFFTDQHIISNNASSFYIKICSPYDVIFQLQSMFFFLVQSEQGDLFKITLEHDEDVVCHYLSVFFYVYEY